MPETQTNSPVGFSPELFVEIDPSDRRRLRAQLEQQLRRAIQDGRLSANTRLPASRMLARDLGVARTVVVHAYEQLVADGYLEARQGSGTRVRKIPSTPRRRMTPPAVRGWPTQFVGGLPDPATFPRAEWQREYRDALAALPDPKLGYPNPRGTSTLRRALASYLGRARGVQTSPDEIVVTTGFTQGLVLLCRVLRERNVTRIAVEEPCFALHREAVAVAGLQPIPVGIDANGMDTRRLPHLDVGAVLLAPAHSYPTGAVLSPRRRGELVQWAADSGTLIIEDDYDAEFRYDRLPIGALQGIGPDHVVYGGCASKTLNPALRLGWLAAPNGLIAELVHHKLYDDMGSGLIEQLTLARFIESGGFARHVRRVRALYRQRRDAAIAAVLRYLPEARIQGAAAGLHLYLELPDCPNQSALLAAARERGAQAEAAGRHWANPSAAPAGLILAYGAVTTQATSRSVRALAAAYRDCGRRARRGL